MDDFLNKDIADELEKFLSNENIPWYLHTDSVGKMTNKECKPRIDDEIFNNPCMVHAFIKDGLMNSSMLETRQIKQFLNSLNKGDIVFRMKANLSYSNPINNEYKYGVPHIDAFEEHYVALYYVNDSDGDTILFDKDEKTIIDRITPKKGRCLFFKGDIPHSASGPVKSKYRIVINTNLYYGNI